MPQSLIKRKQLLLDIFNAPDGQYGCDENVPNLLPGDSLELALDKLTCILDKLAPPKPPNLSESVLTIGVTPTNAKINQGVGYFRGTNTQVPTLIIGDNFTELSWDPLYVGSALPGVNTDIFFDSDNGILTFNMNQAVNKSSDITQNGNLLSFDSSTLMTNNTITGLSEISSVTFSAFEVPGPTGSETGTISLSSPNSIIELTITKDADYHDGVLGAAEFWYGFDALAKFRKGFLTTASLSGTNDATIPSSGKVGGFLSDHLSLAVDLGMVNSVFRAYGQTASLNHNEVYTVKMEHSTSGVAKINKDNSFTLESSHLIDPTSTPQFIIGAVGGGGTPATRDKLVLPENQVVPFNFTINGPSAKTLNGVPSIDGIMDFTVNYNAINISKYYYKNNNVNISSSGSTASVNYTNMRTSSFGSVGNAASSSVNSTHNIDPIDITTNQLVSVNTVNDNFFYGYIKFLGTGSDVLNVSDNDDAFAPDRYYWDNDVETVNRYQSDALTSLGGGNYKFTSFSDVLFKNSIRDNAGGLTPWSGFEALTVDGNRETQRTNFKYIFPRFDYRGITKPDLSGGPNYDGITNGVVNWNSFRSMIFKINSGIVGTGAVVGFDVNPKPIGSDLGFISLDNGATWFSLSHGQGSASGWQQISGANVVGTILGSPPFAFASAQVLNSTVLIRYIMNDLNNEYSMVNGPLFTKI